MLSTPIRSVCDRVKDRQPCTQVPSLRGTVFRSMGLWWYDTLLVRCTSPGSPSLWYTSFCLSSSSRFHGLCVYFFGKQKVGVLHYSIPSLYSVGRLGKSLRSGCFHTCFIFTNKIRCLNLICWLCSLTERSRETRLGVRKETEMKLTKCRTEDILKPSITNKFKVRPLGT